jgi:hypothetical protein
VNLSAIDLKPWSVGSLERKNLKMNFDGQTFKRSFLYRFETIYWDMGLKVGCAVVFCRFEGGCFIMGQCFKMEQ